MNDPSRRELADTLEELEATLEELRAQLEPDRRRFLGVPRPPSPRDLLRVTDEYAIPAAIAALEANIRALELLRAGIRMTEPDRAAREAGGATTDRAATAGREALDRLERALSDVEAALSGPGTPADPEARALLDDARRLDEEIRDRIEASGRPPRGESVRIDVEEELDSIRREVGDPEEATSDEAGEG